MITLILMICFFSHSHGLVIDVQPKNEERCDRRSLQIICQSSATELGSNKLTISLETTVLTSCQRNGMNCSKVMDGYSAPTFDGETAILEVKMVDFTNKSITWSCMAGTAKAETKTIFWDGYFYQGPDPCSMDRPWHNAICGMSAVIIIAVLFVVIVILGLCLVYKICREKCRGCCRGRERPVNQNGYTGTHHEVRMTYTIEDPDHVPDATAKNMPARTEEARQHCSNYDQKEAATEKLEQYVKDRVEPQEEPLLSPKS